MILIQNEKLHEVLRSFYTLTGIRIAVFNEWHHEIAAYPQELCAFCQNLRTDPFLDHQCQLSDQKAFHMVKQTRQQYTYRCHAGLYESLYPIIIDNCLVGFLMIGQFIQKNEQTTNAIAAIMAICAEYLCFSKTVSTKHTGVAEKIDQYITHHLNEPMSVQLLADLCGISRTSLHLLFKESFGKSITEYINYKKIEKAKELIHQNISTQEILSQINISDANYFCRLFKKYTGLSLRAYKQNQFDNL